jgi:hypothetical protein
LPSKRDPICTSVITIAINNIVKWDLKKRVLLHKRGRNPLVFLDHGGLFLGREVVLDVE